jgi:hypothetical protein
MTQKKLDLAGSVGLVKIAQNNTVTFNHRCRRQGWTEQCEVIYWISNFGSGVASLVATATVTSDTDATGVTWEIAGTASASASDAIPYTAVIDFGSGDRADEQTLENVTVEITTEATSEADLYVYGRTIRQLPYEPTTMELAP